MVPPLKPGPVQVYVNADGPPFNETVDVEQVIEPVDDAVTPGNVVFVPTVAIAVFVHPFDPVTDNV